MQVRIRLSWVSQLAKDGLGIVEPSEAVMVLAGC